MTMTFDRRQFCSAPPRRPRALALRLRRDRAPIRDRGARSRIFMTQRPASSGMLRISPETATGLGASTPTSAPTSGASSSDSGPGGKSGAYRAPCSTSCRPCAGSTGQGCRAPREGLARHVLWLGERVSDVAAIPYGEFDGYPIPYAISRRSATYQGIPDFLDSQHRIETREDRGPMFPTRGLRRQLLTWRSSRGPRRCRAKGVVPPAYIIDKTLNQTRTLPNAAKRRASFSRWSVARARRTSAGDWGCKAYPIVDGRIAAALDRQIAFAHRIAPRRGHQPRRRAAARRRALLPDVPALPHLDQPDPDEARAIGLRQIAGKLSRRGRSVASPRGG